MLVEIFPEKNGEYINLNAFNEEDGILGVMQVHENANEIEITDITIFPEYSYTTVVDALFEFLMTLWEDSESEKVINITYELDDESRILHYYLHEREDFMFASVGGIYRTTMKDAALFIDNPEMKKLSTRISNDVKTLKSLTDKQMKDIASRLMHFSIMEKEDAENLVSLYDQDLSCAIFNKETGDVNTALLARYDGEDTLCIDAAFATDAIQFMELVVFFVDDALKKYPNAKLELSAVNEKSEALCDNFAEKIMNVTKAECYTGIWTGVRNGISEYDYV